MSQQTRNSRIIKTYISKYPTCEFCGKDAEEVHHIIPVVKGGTDKEENLMSLCKNCHKTIHERITPRGELINIGRRKAKENPQPKVEPKKEEPKITDEEKRINEFLGMCVIYAMELFREIVEEGTYTELNDIFPTTKDKPPKEDELIILLSHDSFMGHTHGEIKSMHNNIIHCFGVDYSPQILRMRYITVTEIIKHPKYNKDLKEHYKKLGLHTERKQVAKGE